MRDKEGREGVGEGRRERGREKERLKRRKEGHGKRISVCTTGIYIKQ